MSKKTNTPKTSRKAKSDLSPAQKAWVTRRRMAAEAETAKKARASKRASKKAPATAA